MLFRARSLWFPIISLASLLALIIVYLYVNPSWKSPSWAHKPGEPNQPFTPLTANLDLNSCPKNLDYINALSIIYPIKYARRDIIVNANPDTKRTSVTKIDAQLFPDSQLVDLTASTDVELKNCMEPLLLDVPTLSTPIDASHVLFGMATPLDRLEKSIPYLLRWLPGTNARLFVIATGPDETDPDVKELKEMEDKMRGFGLEVTIVKPVRSGDDMASRYFSLVKVLYENREEGKTKWIGLVDDDTFFPSMHSLITKLNTFNADQQLYLGGMSEEWWAVVRYGLMAFGGAGIFLSLPLAEVLDANYEECKWRSGAGAGDMRIRECIIWHTNTKLTHVEGLHQIDIHGDLSGLYESGRLHLSLHHWKQGWWDEGGFGSWFPMSAMHLVADVCGDCFLQRWQFNSDLVLANGYSVASYPSGKLKELGKDRGWEKPENTWEGAGIVEGANNPGWDHYIGPLRPMLKLEEEKVQYRFLDAVAVDGGVRQFYIHMGVDGDLDTLLEIFWIRRADADSAGIESSGNDG